MDTSMTKTGASRLRATVAAFAVALASVAVGIPGGAAEAASVPAHAKKRSDPKPPKPPKEKKYKHWKRLKKLSDIPERAEKPNMRKQLEGMQHVRLSSFFLSDGKVDRKYFSAYYTTPRGYTYKMRVDKNGKVVQHVLVKRPTSDHQAEPPPKKA